MRSKQLLHLSPFALAGVVVFISLHVYFVSSWPEYVVSLGPYYEQAMIEPYMGHTPLSVRVGQRIICILAMVVALAAGRQAWRAVLAFWFGLITTQLSVLILATEFPGNLWPIGLVLEVFRTAAPVVLGGGLGLLAVFLFKRFRGQAN